MTNKAFTDVIIVYTMDTWNIMVTTAINLESSCSKHRVFYLSS